MRIFGINFKVKKEPRWASLESYAELSASIQTLGKAVESMRAKVYREDKAAADKSEVEAVLSGGNGDGPEPAPAMKPGQLLTPEQVERIGG